MADASATTGFVMPPRPGASARVLAALTHVGLLVVCASAVYTLQPSTMGQRSWLALALVALGALVQVVMTRGRSGASAGGKTVTALLAGIVLSLAYDPQLGNLPGLGEKLPTWLADLSPGVALLGVLWAALWGYGLLARVGPPYGPAQPTPYVRPLLTGAVLVGGLAVVMFVVLGRVYEVDPLPVTMLVSQVVQYAALLGVVLGVTGRPGVGSGATLYLAVTVLAALARNLVAGGGGA
jgi:hypothetical protein